MTDPNTTWAAPEGTDPVAATTPVPVVKPKAKSGGLTNALLLVAVLIAVGGVTFAIGRATAPASAASGVTSGFGPGGSWAGRELRSRHACRPARTAAASATGR